MEEAWNDLRRAIEFSISAIDSYARQMDGMSFGETSRFASKVKSNLRMIDKMLIHQLCRARSDEEITRPYRVKIKNLEKEIIDLENRNTKLEADISMHDQSKKIAEAAVELARIIKMETGGYEK